MFKVSHNIVLVTQDIPVTMRYLFDLGGYNHLFPVASANPLYLRPIEASQIKKFHTLMLPFWQIYAFVNTTHISSLKYDSI